MEQFPRERQSCRRSKALLLGLLLGISILVLFLLPFRISSCITEASEAFRQQNLIPGRGDAISDFHTVEVSVFVLLNGKVQEGMSVSPDSMKWYTPQNGAVSLELPPGEYKFCAAFDNRSVSATHRVGTGSPNELILDAGLAPLALGLLMLEGIKDETLVFPLDIAHADSVYLEDPPNGLSVIRQGAAFSLVVDGELLSYGFHAVALRAENQYGKVITWIGIRIPRGDTSTPIYTVEDLEQVRQGLSGSYILMNDLDMSGVGNWQPIGGGAYPFTGVFDGGGHEIMGFHSPDMLLRDEGFSFLGCTKNAEIRNIIFRKPWICPGVVEDEGSGCAVIASSLERGIMENCAVIGGRVAPADGGAHGIVGGNGGIMLSLFNSADVICLSPNSNLQNTGGVVGNNIGYGAYLANEGEVFGTHLAGGIVGWHHGGVIQRSVNCGYIWGNQLVGEFPAGGIAHTVNDDAICTYGYFVRGQSAVGGKSFSKSIVSTLFPIEWAALRNPSKMTWLGTFEGENPDWAFASLDAKGPVPYGIFTGQAETPVAGQSGDSIIIPPIEGLNYFYTLDGSDPHIAGTRADSISITLTHGQVLSVFSARLGYRDSELLVCE